jgi:hypothetical protein
VVRRWFLPYCIAGILGLPLVSAQVPILPLREVKAGMRAIGKTVFEGDRVQEFGVEILGILENSGPGQNIILARLSGGPLEHTGVAQGMSGSPVYVDGKLIGAVALGFPFSKDPIAGIRPIEEMLEAGKAPLPKTARRNALDKEPVKGKLAPIATPVSFSGFTEQTLDKFAPQLRSLGLEPRQGVNGGGSTTPRTSGNQGLTPGSMISVQLMSGDMNIGADGTVTHVEGKKVYAFGHRFLSAGPTDLPFARSSVITMLPNVNSSFKISSSGETLGAITHDQNAAVVGELGRAADLVPVEVVVNGQVAKRAYRMKMINDSLLSPLLLQMAVFSTVEATERTLGSGTMEIRGTVEFAGDLPPVKLHNVYAGDFNVPLQVSLASALPLSYVLQNSLETPKLQRVSIELTPTTEKKQLQIESAWTSRRQVRPGETVEFNVLLTGPNGAESVQKVSYVVPIGAPAGPLYFTAADGVTANTAEYRQFGVSQPRPARELVTLINELRGNRSAYVRVWRADPSYNVQGTDLPDPPPSAGLIFSKLNQNSLAAPRTSKVAEFELAALDAVVTGSRTVRVDVRD